MKNPDKAVENIDDIIEVVSGLDEEFTRFGEWYHLDPITMKARLMLELPRMGCTHGSFRHGTRTALSYVRERQALYADWIKPPWGEVYLEDLYFTELDEETARIYHENLHYIGTYRPGHHYALRDRDGGRIVCMGSVAPCDLYHAITLVWPQVRGENIMVGTRFFAYRWAPPNIFSFFCGKLRDRLKQQFKTELLFTWINPNIGFDGGGHRAAQWQSFGLEGETRYMYLDGVYRPMRFFVDKYGTSDPVKLREQLGSAFEVNAIPLKPMILLANALHKRAEGVIPQDQPYRLERPTIGKVSVLHEGNGKTKASG